MTASILESYGHFRRSLARLGAAQFKKTDLGFFQMSIIYFLGSDEASSCSELAECTQTDPAAVSRALTSMCKLGLITRVKHQTDRRRERIQLTSAGKQKAVEVFKARDQIAGKIAQALNSKEAKELARLLEKAALATE